MGLDTTHNAWHGAYSAFNRWRTMIAHVAGFPPLELMEGFYFEKEHNPFTLLDIEHKGGNKLAMSAINRIRERLPIKWDLFNSPLVELLTHSDCDGEIEYSKCNDIANELEKLLPSLEKQEDGGGHIGSYKNKTEQFICGLRLAYKDKENIEFH